MLLNKAKDLIDQGKITFDIICTTCNNNIMDHYHYDTKEGILLVCNPGEQGKAYTIDYEEDRVNEKITLLLTAAGLHYIHVKQ